METLVARLTRRAPAILFLTSAIVLVGGIVGAMLVASFTVQQAQNAMLSGAATSAYGVARSQLLIGITGALQAAVWPFSAGALIRSLQSKPIH